MLPHSVKTVPNYDKKIQYLPLHSVVPVLLINTVKRKHMSRSLRYANKSFEKYVFFKLVYSR
jgi:hypothetical protein